jgi:DNA/RNA-binding domain of Phe-tRNA-synthetase-like protein
MSKGVAALRVSAFQIAVKKNPCTGGVRHVYCTGGVEMKQVPVKNEHESFTVAGIELGGDAEVSEDLWRRVEGVVGEVRGELSERYRDFGRADFKRLAMFEPYISYFKIFKKTYHLMLQLESFAHGERPLPRIHPLVTVYFLGELRNGVLSSIHDADAVEGALRLVRTAGDERLTLFSGEERKAPADDASLFDELGLLTCVIQGQDARSMVTADTRRACIIAYGVPGVGRDVLDTHLEDVRGLAARFGLE